MLKLSTLAVATFLVSNACANFDTATRPSEQTGSWEADLHRALGSATRMRVRSGGTCHRDIDDEETLFQTTDQTLIGKVVTGIRLDEQESGFHCLCCGRPTFEFYKGDVLVAMIGFHHGSSLRWSEGWSADALLTEASAEFLLHFLADHGVPGPFEERLEMQQSSNRVARIEKIRGERYRAVMSETLAAAVFASRSDEETIAIFAKIEPVERAIVALRLYGSHDADWDMQSGFDRLVAERFLGAASPEVLVLAMKASLRDSQGVNGVARWLFGDLKIDGVAPEVVGEILQTIGPPALAHPSALNRRRTISVLKTIGGPSAISLLRKRLSGVIEPRDRNPEEDTTLGGWVVFGSEDIEVDDDCSDRAFAALALAQLRDRASIPVIAALAINAREADRKVLDEALRVLKKAE